MTATPTAAMPPELMAAGMDACAAISQRAHHVTRAAAERAVAHPAIPSVLYAIRLDVLEPSVFQPRDVATPEETATLAAWLASAE